MKTPAEYRKKLKNGIITLQMLTDCLYSVSKRAKNYRDKEREYKKYRQCGFYDKYDNEGKNRAEKERYYGLKEELLKVLEPTCIHKEAYTYVKKKRYYSYQNKYFHIDKSAEILRKGQYYDKDFYDYVQFVDVADGEETRYRYYLYYDLGTDHSFHHPIDDPAGYDLEIKEIDSIISFGQDINDLLSLQFVMKVIDRIHNGDYRLCA